MLDNSPDLSAFVGLYGQHEPFLDIYERDGGLHAHGLGLDHEPLSRSRVTLSLNEGGPEATIGDARLRRYDFAGMALTAFRKAIAGDLTALRAASLAAQPPAGTRPGELVDLAAVAPDIAIDMRYASANNFIGAPLYDSAVALLRPEAAAALSDAQSRLRERGYRLLVLDAYRPWSVTWLFWNIVPIEARDFVADPAIGSKHNRGCAVDVTLLDLADGVPVEMPSDYDEPSVRAHADYYGSTTVARANRDLLRGEMEKAGFSVEPNEWWHYDFAGWEGFPIANAPLSALA